MREEEEATGTHDERIGPPAKAGGPHPRRATAGGGDQSGVRDARLVAAVREHDDRDALQALVTEYLGLVRHIARRNAAHDDQVDDLVQEGLVGLLKAIRASSRAGASRSRPMRARSSQVRSAITSATGRPASGSRSPCVSSGDSSGFSRPRHVQRPAARPTSASSQHSRVSATRRSRRLRRRARPAQGRPAGDRGGARTLGAPSRPRDTPSPARSPRARGRLPQVLRGPDPGGDRRRASASPRCTSRACCAMRWRRCGHGRRCG